MNPVVNKMELVGEYVRIILSDCKIIIISKTALEEVLYGTVNEDCKTCGNSDWKPFNMRENNDH
jgi:hypothetical protein